MLNSDFFEDSLLESPRNYRDTKKRGKSKKTKSRNSSLPFSPQEKQPSPFRANELIPATPNQRLVANSFRAGKSMLLHGTAGTGKTYLGCALGMEDVLDSENTRKKLIVIRSTVPSRDQGFLPGGPAEKAAVYEKPYAPVFAKIFSRGDAWEYAKKKGLVEFESTSYLRGMTLENCVIVFDEIQNATYAELSTVATRIGKNCRIIFSGDFHQSDLEKDNRGVLRFMRVLKAMCEIDFYQFTVDDIVRSGFCKSFIIAEESLRLKGE